MKQALHIFRKDVRHLRPEIAVSVSLLVAFCVLEPRSWAGWTADGAMPQTVGTLLSVLLPITWLVLIARVVQQERLAGDQQYWVTRPIAWKSLLGAKLLFVLAWVVTPFAVMQWVLLLEAGLHPWRDLSGMLATLLTPALILWLPFFAIAVVTPNLVKSSLTVLAVLLTWATMLTIFSSTAGTTAPYTTVVLALVCGGMLAGCVVYVYRTRETRPARWWLAATGAMFFVLMGCLSQVYAKGVCNLLVRWHYAVEAKSQVRLVMHPEIMHSRDTAHSGSSRDAMVMLHLPLVLEGLGADEKVHFPNAQLRLEAPGYSYVSRWGLVVPTEDGIWFEVPAGVYARVSAAPVHVRVSLATQRLRQSEYVVVQAQDAFVAPDGGRCVLAGDRLVNNLVCRYAYHGPPPTWVTTRVTTGKCGAGVEDHLAGAGTRTIPSGLNPDPTVEETFALGGRVCTGTPVAFRVSKPTGDLRVEADVPDVSLARYVVR